MNNLAAKIFKYRSYTPIPFLIVMLIFQRADIESLIIGFVIALAGEGFRFWGVAVAGSETRTTGPVGGSYLVVTGAFAYVRNPLYVGNILLYVGIGVMSMALFPYLQIIALVYFIFQYRLIVGEEENYLRETYKEEYEKYTKAVPRFFPRFSPYNTNNLEQPPVNIKAGLKSEKRTLQAFLSVTLILIILYIIG